VVKAIQHRFEPAALIAGSVAQAAAAGIAIDPLSARLFGHDHHHDLRGCVERDLKICKIARWWGDVMTRRCYFFQKASRRQLSYDSQARYQLSPRQKC